MSVIGNLFWILFGGFVHAFGWLIAGILCCITIIGIPVGKQCFKIAHLQLLPFGKEVRSKKDTTFGLIANILWIIFLGWELALANLFSALIFAVTIIGIPFAMQSIKLAKLSLMPFGKEIVHK